MTVQTKEKLIYNGRQVDIVAEPLTSYILSIKTTLGICPVSSGCWRGYVGTWLIEDSKLYLIGFDGHAMIKPGIIEQVGIDYLFPGETKVFAYWFSGELRIPDGELLHFKHDEFSPIYEIERYLDFSNGHYIEQRLVDNLLKFNRELL